MKINFTKEHFERMCSLLMAMLISNDSIATKMGTPLNVVELLHTTTIGTLNTMRNRLGTQIEAAERQDEWIATETIQRKLENLKAQKELVNLIIGYKRYNLELQENKAKKAELTAKLQELKESQKTPEDKIKELEAQLAEIDAEESF